MFQNLIQKAYEAPSGFPGTTAAGSGAAGDYNTLLGNILENIVNPIISLMMAVAVLYFLWGVFDFVRNADSPDKRKEGGMHMLWGAIGLMVMIAAYGIMSLILGTIGK